MIDAMTRPTALPAALLALGAAASTRAADGAHDCLIEPWQRVEIRSPVIGVIERIEVDRGGAIKTGQTLLTLDTGVEQAAFDAATARAKSDAEINVAKARAEFARAKFKRAEDLREQHFVSGQDHDQAQAELRVAEAELALAQDNRRLAAIEARRLGELLRQRSLRAPFVGVVTERLQHPGELAFTGEGARPILKLAQINPLRVEVVLPVALLGTIKVGHSAEVTPEPPLKGSWRATIKVVDHVVDSASGSFGVRLELPNPQGELPAGVRCRVKF